MAKKESNLDKASKLLVDVPIIAGAMVIVGSGAAHLLGENSILPASIGAASMSFGLLGGFSVREAVDPCRENPSLVEDAMLRAAKRLAQTSFGRRISVFYEERER